MKGIYTSVSSALIRGGYKLRAPLHPLALCKTSTHYFFFFFLSRFLLQRLCLVSSTIIFSRIVLLCIYDSKINYYWSRGAQGRWDAPELILTSRVSLGDAVGINSWVRTSGLAVRRLRCHVKVGHRWWRKRRYRSVHWLTRTCTWEEPFIKVINSRCCCRFYSDKWIPCSLEMFKFSMYPAYWKTSR